MAKYTIRKPPEDCLTYAVFIVRDTKESRKAGLDEIELVEFRETEAEAIEDAENALDDETGDIYVCKIVRQKG
jgi:hypothetical protein